MPDPSNFAQIFPEPIKSKVDKFKAKIIRNQVDRKGRTVSTTILEQDLD